MNILGALDAPTAGEVRFNGRTITGRPPYDIARMGLVRTFQLARELALQAFGGQLDRGQGVLDFMGESARHFTPGL